jgi:hypothetical protein
MQKPCSPHLDSAQTSCDRVRQGSPSCSIIAVQLASTVTPAYVSDPGCSSLSVCSLIDRRQPHQFSQSVKTIVISQSVKVSCSSCFPLGVAHSLQKLSSVRLVAWCLTYSLITALNAAAAANSASMPYEGRKARQIQVREKQKRSILPFLMTWEALSLTYAIRLHRARFLEEFSCIQYSTSALLQENRQLATVVLCYLFLHPARLSAVLPLLTCASLAAAYRYMNSMYSCYS